MASAQQAPTNRTVNDFDTEDDLRMALMNMNIRSRDDCAELRESAAYNHNDDERMAGNDHHQAKAKEEEDVPLNDDWDWTLTNYDVETTEPQTITQEVQRLRTLQSYQIVGAAERVEAFDRLCNLGSRVFDVPITFVALVDMGRQWFASKHGMEEETKETPRNVAFCNYTIQHKEDMLIIPDATKDARFRDNIYVTGQAHIAHDSLIRFYAGAPLLSPEGHRLGTFCMIDTKPWPNGLTEVQKENLRDFASMAMKTLVDRRELRQTKANRDDALHQLVASAAHDLLTPLTGMRHTLQQLQEDQGLQKQLELRHKQSLSTTMAAADVMHQICTTTLDQLEEPEMLDKNNQKQDGEEKKPKSIQGKPKQDDAEQDKDASSSSSVSVVDVKDCMQRLHSIIDPFPKQVPVIFSLETDVPRLILSNDLMITRASLALLSNACSITTKGKIQFRVFQREGQLVFECEDSRPAVMAASMEKEDDNQQTICCDSTCGTASSPPLEKEMPALGLSSLASQVKALGGKYGYRTHGLSPSSIDSRGRPKTGVYFWFSVPIKEPDASMVPKLPAPTNANTNANTNGASRESKATWGEQQEIYPIAEKEEEASATEFVGETDKSTSLLDVPMVTSCSEEDDDDNNDNPYKQTRHKRALVIEDSAVVRKSISKALTKQGYEVVEAVDGLEGLAELQDNIFDVTFCDFIMPNLNGPQCVEQYRKFEKKHRPQFSQYIIGIGRANEGDISVGLAAGMNEYRPKPMTTQVITELCNGKTVKSLSAFLDKLPFRLNQFVFSPSEKAREPPPVREINDILCAPPQRRTTRSRDDMELGDTESLSCVTVMGTGCMRSAKRMKLSELVATTNCPEKICLLVTKQSITDNDAFARNMKAMGWKIVTVDERNEVLQLLKARRWGVVLLFDDLLAASEGGFIAKFREWESANRSNRQENVFLVRGCGLYSNGTFTGDLPTGFDAEINRSLLWEQLKGKLGSCEPVH